MRTEGVCLHFMICFSDPAMINNIQKFLLIDNIFSCGNVLIAVRMRYSESLSTAFANSVASGSSSWTS